MSAVTTAAGVQEPVSNEMIRFLEDRKLDTDIALRLGVHGTHERITFPFIKGGEVVNNKHRRLNEKNFFQDAGGEKCFWNYDVITDRTLAHQPLIITEGECDALAAATAGFVRVVSCPDGAPTQSLADDQHSRKYSFLDDAYDDLLDVKEIILATDDDGPGQILRDDLAKRLGKGRCKWVRYPKECKDLNDALMKYGVAGVKKAIEEHSNWMPVSGVYKMSDLPPSPSRPTYALGMGAFDDHMKIRLGDFAVWSGVPGHGKSSAVNHICCKMADQHSLKTIFASFEQNPQDDHRENLEIWWLEEHGGGANFTPDGVPRFKDAAQRQQCHAWIDRNFFFLYPDDDEFPTVDYILERVATVILRHDVNIVVIDPWNEVEHEVGNKQSTHEYTSLAIRKFKKFAKKWGVHLIIVAHPTKIKAEMRDKPITLYDIADTASWANRCDLGVIVHAESDGIMAVLVVKSRYHRKIGKPGVKRFQFTPLDNHLRILPEEEGVFFEKFPKK